MKAVYIEQHGGTEVFKYGDRPEPVPGEDEVKIRVRAASLNRLDIFRRMGVRGTKQEFPEPAIIGQDVAGDVAAVGSKVFNVKVGDRVVVNPKFVCNQCPNCLRQEYDICTGMGRGFRYPRIGGYAEFAKAPAHHVHKITPNVSYEEAAALPTAYLTVWNGLYRKVGIKPWHTVLVPSGSGGVGTATIDIVKHAIQARLITTTSSDEKAKRLKELGADVVINYKTEDVVKRVMELTGNEGVHAIMDHVGQDFWQQNFACLAREGHWVICGVTSGYRAELHQGQVFTRALHILGVDMGTPKDMEELVSLLNRGIIKPLVAATFPLKDAAKAHELMESTSFIGKIVLKP